MMTARAHAARLSWMTDFTLTAAEFRALYERLRRTSEQGPADRRGALNNISSAEVIAAASDVRDGRTVSLAAPINSIEAIDNPDPAVHEMTHWADKTDADGLSFATDRLAMNIHGDADSHIDALCHVIYDGELYNGIAADSVTSAGATELSIDVAGQGIAGRGLLLDIPRVRGVPWLEPGEHVTADDLRAAESAAGVDFPVHVLAVNAMGLHLLDYLNFDALARLCEELRRWSFLCVVAPLRLREDTGSLVNPIAVLKTAETGDSLRGFESHALRLTFGNASVGSFDTCFPQSVDHRWYAAVCHRMSASAAGRGIYAG
jgi:Putative cyclase